MLDCKACGSKTNVDLRQKLSSFILKNAPKKGKKDKSTKKADRKARKEAEKNGNGDVDSVNGNGHPSPGDSGSDHPGDEDGDLAIEAGSDDELTRKINAEAKELNEPEQDKEVEWSVDMSEAAIKARAKALPEDLKSALVIEEDGEDAEGGSNTKYDELGKWIESKAEEEGGVGKVKDVDIYLKAKELGIETKHRTVQVLAQTIFDDNIVKQIEPRAGMLKKMITSEKHEKALLGGTERFVGVEKPNLIPTVSAILVKFYENDLCSEEVLKSWGSKASGKYVDKAVSKKVRKSAEKFMEWLNNAESDEDSDDE